MAQLEAGNKRSSSPKVFAPKRILLSEKAKMGELTCKN